MAASISFNDGSGSQTITPTAGDQRFNGWRPLPMTIGERAVGLGDGDTYQWVHRTDYGAAWRLPNLANSTEAVLQAFLLHANQGGVFTLTTDDSEANVYDSCKIAPGTLIELSDPDPETLEYTLTGAVINRATAATPLRCVYV